MTRKPESGYLQDISN